ncbi:DUF748 domain-containing protein [Lutimonas halocynthiae]|uniref:DUF748 domain-containing protein n=1 Tax=Lutimonas halocynthiae TaxID=1446477 RepID=UPI0025B2A272|nr:DUF748 domain-containing protein [Lutimonas halocynthiae]MDN3644407.1 DUF748 domain-containing protein [Lutimonas halocynthiae]
MKKYFIRIVIVLGLLFLILKGIEMVLEATFQAKINANPDRAYNITYEDFDFHTFFKGVTLDEVRIQPLNETGGTVITGNVDYATLKGLVWIELLFGKRLSIREISFEQPVFEVTLSNDTVKKTSGKGIQAMFGDILSRAKLSSFSIRNGSVILKEPESGTIKGQIKKVNIQADEIETDSIRLKNIIPFLMGNLIVDIEDVNYDLNEYTHLSLGSIEYNLQRKEMLLEDISLGYSIDWVEVSNRLGIQNDVIEFDIKSLAIHQLEPSKKFYTDLDIKALSIGLDSLHIKLQRNKNLTRPPDVAKPMFKEMVDAIPIALDIDSVHITNSSVTYSELGVKKENSGTIEINQINGNIAGVTNIPELQQELGDLKAKLTASFGGHAAIYFDLLVPYHGESFNLDIEMGGMELTKLNPILTPLAGVEIKSGQLTSLKYHMSASRVNSQNKLIFDYNDLHMNMLKETKDHTERKRLFLSAVANAAIRNNNMPDQEKYLTAEYQSERNIYRSPVNYIIQGLVQGIIRIVPGKNVQKALTKEKKKKKKKN